MHKCGCCLPGRVVTQALRSAIVGARGVGAAHVAALRAIPGVEVVAVAGSSPASSRETALQLGVSRAASDYLELVEDSSIDVLHICTPNDSHAAIAEAAIAAGKHVICEKPLAIDAAEAGRLVECASRSSAVTVVCYNYRWLPLVTVLRDRVLDGSLGRVHAIRGTYLQNWMLSPQPNWRRHPSRVGSSTVLADIGTHLMDLAEVVTGASITEALADFEGSGHLGSGRDQVSLLLRMSNQVAATLALSQVSPAHTNLLTLEIDGDRGSALWSFDGREELRLIAADSAAQVRVDEHVAGSSAGQYWVSQRPADTAVKGFLAATYAAIRDRTDTDPATADRRLRMPLPQFVDGLRHAEVIDTVSLNASRSPLQAIGASTTDRTDAPDPPSAIDLASPVER